MSDSEKKETKLIKREVYTYIEKTQKVIKEYNFWRTPYETWKIMKTVYSVDGESTTEEIILPDEVLSKIITDTAKENLTNE